jgi:hypothetical protein
MNRTRLSQAALLIVLAVASASCAQKPPVTDAPLLATPCPEGAGQADCLARLYAALAGAALATSGSCGVSSCTPGPAFMDRRLKLTNPADLDKVIRGFVLYAQSQGLSPAELAARVQQAAPK